MAEPFKNLVGAQLVADLQSHLRRVHRRFPADRFVQLATTGLDALELKARVQHVAKALSATLPTDFVLAADVIEAALLPARLDDDLQALRTGPEGLAGFAVWPLTEFVAAQGLRHPERALQALHAMTQRATAEFAIRPFLVEHERLTLATLQRWTRDASPHVRRLVSEGSRPRLPWGLQLQRFIADPSPTLPLLEALQDDPSEYVRRSVANHLNDIAKDHPAVVAEWLDRFLPDASKPRRALLKHASRTLVKRGDQRVLRAWGLGGALRGEVQLRLSPTRPRIGTFVELQIELCAKGKQPQPIVLDYRVGRQRKDGGTTQKVWKGFHLTLAAGEVRELRKRHPLRQVSTRRLEPGAHKVTVLVNGREVAAAAFELRA